MTTHDYTSTATGPRVLDLLKGSEGVFGVLTELTIKIFRYMPENRKYFAYLFPGWESAVSAAREVCKGQFGLPAVLRISDAEETDHSFQLYPQPPALEWILERLGFHSGQRSICLGTVEGDSDFTRLVQKKIRKTARRFGGLYIGKGPAKSWERDRYTSFLISEATSDFDILLDTVETPVRWDNLQGS